MNLICSRSYPSSLQMQALLSIGKSISFPKNTSIFKCLELPPGLTGIIKNNYWWIVTNKRDEDRINAAAENSKESHRPKKCANEAAAGQRGVPISIHFDLDGAVTRSRARAAAEMAAGPAEAAKLRSRSKSCGSRSSSEQPGPSKSVTSCTGGASSAGHCLQPGVKRRLDSKNSGPSKKK